MKILILSRSFYPSLGGSETNAEILAREFHHLGHKVKIITQTIGSDLDVNGLIFPFEVIRIPKLGQMISLIKWCDVYLHNGISLRGLWPLILFRRPWVVRHQVWLRTMDGSITKTGGNSNSLTVKFKHWITQFATSISISESIADHLQSPSTVIPNPYRDNLFRIIPDINKTKELVFLGRLVSEKGVEMLLQALAQLADSGLRTKLTIVGDGPDKLSLEKKSEELRVNHQVIFIGSKVGEELVSILNEHQIMVIPSLYDEPFGVVALEGIACGCVVVGSEGGGLKDAIADCGVTFPNGNVQALTEALLDLLQDQDQLSKYRANAPKHLLRHQKSAIAKAYLEVLEITVNSSR